jgi:acyl-CoA hydrolase
MVDLMAAGKQQDASTTSLTITADKLQQIVDNMDVYSYRIVLRPQAISNHPGVIRRLGGWA